MRRDCRARLSALIAIDERDRRVGAMLRVLQRDGVPVPTGASAVAQIWRHGRWQANLARVLAGVDTSALDHEAAKKVGELLGANRSTDLVDAHVALLVEPGGRVFRRSGPMSGRASGIRRGPGEQGYHLGQ